MAGGIIRINGTVEGDLWAAGQTVIVNGTLKDDARIAGYALTVGGEVVDDLLAAGFSLENERGSSAGGDLLFAGYQALLAGDVTGNADVAGGAVRIDGTVGGHVNVDLGDAEPGERMPPGFPFAPNLPPVSWIPGGLTLGSGASIGGDLSYKACCEIAIPAGAVAGEVEFERRVPAVEPERVEPRAPSPALRVGGWFVRQLRRLATLLVVGVLMMWLVPDWTRKVSDIVRTKPLLSLGWGVVVIAGFAVGMLALLIVTMLLAVVFGVVTLGGLAGRIVALGSIAMSTVAFSFSITWAYVTRIAISLLLGQLVFKLFSSTAAEHRWWPMLLGVLIFIAITAIPVLGWLATLATVLLGLGAVWLWFQSWLGDRKVPPAVMEQA